MWKITLTIKQNSIWELQQELNNLEYIEIHLKRNPTENSIQKKKEKKNHQLGVPGGRSGFRIHTPQKPSKASKNSKP